MKLLLTPLFLLSVLASTSANPVHHDNLENRAAQPTFSYVSNVQQFLSDYQAGKTMNWTQVASDMSAWQSQAQQNAKMALTAVKPSSSASASASASSSASASASKSSSATPSPSSAGSSSTGTQDTANKAQFIQLHTDFRSHYGANPVTWNDTLAAYAYKTASTCKYGHTNGPYGENIAAGVGGGYNVLMGFQSWSNESKAYNWSAPGYSEGTGHFTQIVWKATSQIGCAAYTCADGTIFSGYRQNSLYLVCEYFQPGNWVDPSNQKNTVKYFTDNVGTYQK